MAGRVDDVQADAGIVDRRLLGQDRDPLLPLEVARVEDPLDDGLVRPERAGLAEHRVDERRLAVIDVGDDREIAQVAPNGEGRAGTGRVQHGDRIVARPDAGPDRVTCTIGR